MTDSKTLHEACAKISQDVAEQKIRDDDRPEIIAVGGYMNGEAGFDAALAAFRRESKIIAVSTPRRPANVFDEIEAAFAREFTKEKPHGKVRR